MNEEKTPLERAALAYLEERPRRGRRAADDAAAWRDYARRNGLQFVEPPEVRQ